MEIVSSDPWKVLWIYHGQRFFTKYATIFEFCHVSVLFYYRLDREKVS